MVVTCRKLAGRLIFFRNKLVNINLGVSLIIYEKDLLHAAEEILNRLFFWTLQQQVPPVQSDSLMPKKPIKAAKRSNFTVIYRVNMQ